MLQVVQYYNWNIYTVNECPTVGYSLQWEKKRKQSLAKNYRVTTQLIGCGGMLGSCST